MNEIALAGLLKIELPSRTLLFSESGFFNFNGETYRDEDDVFGTIGSFRSTSQAVGNTVQSVIVTLLPPDTTAAQDISVPGNQTSPVTLTIVEYDPNTGAILDSDIEYTGQVDQTVLTSGEQTKELTVSVASLMERAFQTNNGNYQSAASHKTIWPGETGHDDATGLVVDDAWGVESPAGNIGATGAGGAGRGGADSIRRIRPY